MDRWAQTYAGRARFICIGCAGEGLALQFGNELRLRHCVLSVARDVEPPRWGQLGCSGFIVLDGELNVVCAKSSAFLEVRERAFDDLEAILGRVLLPRQDGKRQRGNQGGKDLSDGNKAGEASGSAPPATRLTLDLETGGCAGGSCEANAKAGPVRVGAAAGTEAGDVAARAVAPLAALDSVLVASLDAEHEACAAALDRLAVERSSAALDAVIAAYESHFAHEEALLDAHLYAHVPKADAVSAPASSAAQGSSVGGGEGGAGFSAAAGARKSHWADHARLLRELRSGRDAQAQAQTAGGSPVLLSPAFVDRALRGFEEHAGRYDGAYAVPLSVAIAASGPSPPSAP